MFWRAMGFAAVLSVVMTFSNIARADFYRDDKSGRTSESIDDTRELRNAQQLVLLLSKSRKVDNTGIFVQAASAFYAKFNSTLYGKIRKFIDFLGKGDKLPPQLQNIRKLLLIIDVAQAGSAAANELLKYQRATTPNRITAFYAEAGNAIKISEVPGVSTAWRIKRGPTEHQLTFRVTAHIPGTTNGYVTTPAGIATRILAAINADVFGTKNAVYGYLKEWVKEAVVAGFLEARQVVASSSVLTYGFNYSNEWLNSDADAVPIMDSYIGPIDIGDVRSIAVDPNYDHEVIGITSFMPYHKVIGKRYGQTAFFSKFTAPYHSITIDADREITHRMTFEVYGDEPPAPHPNDGRVSGPVLGLPQLPLLPAPPPLPQLGQLPQLPPLPKIPGPSPLPALPSTPPSSFLICESHNGQWNRPDQCEPR